jgi:MFS family permease
MSRRRPVFYGWFIVAACFAANVCLGEVTWSFGVFFKALENEFGWSRSLTSSCYTFMVVGYAISAIVAGRLADRYSSRPVLLVCALLGGPAIAMCSRIETVVHLQILLFIAGLGSGALLSVPSSTVQRWFQDRPRSGVALGLVMAGVGVGALLFAPVIDYLIMAYGWRQAFVFCGVFFFVAVGFAAAVIRTAPTPVSTRADRENEGTSQASLTRQLVRTPQFLLLTAVMTVGVFCYQTLNVHLVPFATDAGISPTVAAAALGLAGAFSVAGRLVFGLLSGSLGWRRSLALAQLGLGGSLLSLMFVDRVWMLYCFVGFYGVSQGARAVSIMGVIGRLFGMRAIGEIIGIMMACAQLAGAFGPYLAGYLHDLWGNYTLIFSVLGVALIICAFPILKFLVASVERNGATEDSPPGV